MHIAQLRPFPRKCALRRCFEAPILACQNIRYYQLPGTIRLVHSSLPWRTAEVFNMMPETLDILLNGDRFYGASAL